MTEVAPTRRRWFQFGLRTMFVAVTIVALGLSWELRIVQQRSALRVRIEARGGALSRNACPSWMGKATTRPALFPKWRRWLGDKHVDDITFVGTSPTEAEITEARRLFPEAMLHTANSARGPSLVLRPE